MGIAVGEAFVVEGADVVQTSGEGEGERETQGFEGCTLVDLGNALRLALVELGEGEFFNVIWCNGGAGKGVVK